MDDEELIARAIARSVSEEDGAAPDKLDMLERCMWEDYRPQARAVLDRLEKAGRQIR